MKELQLKCDSKCISCPKYGRILRIKDFAQRNLEGAFYCQQCGTYSLCPKGIAYRSNNMRELIPVCLKCGEPLRNIKLRYNHTLNNIPFTDKSYIIIRKPNGKKFIIIKTLRGSYFENLSEVFLYTFFTIGIGQFNFVEYNTKNKNYQVIFSGYIEQEKIGFKMISGST